MTEQTTRVPVAVVGVGRMGQHHARTYSKMEGVELVGVVDGDAEKAGKAAESYGTAAYGTTDELLAAHPGVKAVSVAVPTAYHKAVAEPLMERGVSCLIEKPIAETVADAKAMADVAAKSKAVLQVGHTERFNPAVRAVANMDITPRFIEIDRVSPMTFRSLDVGVVKDMMIHDLDIVLMLVGSEIVDVQATGIAILSEFEDICNCRLTFASGCIANLTASRVALKTERRLRLFSESAYVTLDYQRKSGVVLRRSDNEQAFQDLREKIRTKADLSSIAYSDYVQLEKLNMDLPKGQDDPLTAQLTSFLEAVRTGESPVVSAKDGYAAVDAAERVIGAMAQHRWQGRSAEGILGAE
ncbi:MAG: Gfo/Idh/MocA family oxidoreductase [Planctomycetota bacterium]